MYSLTSANRYYLYQGFVRMNLGIDGLFKIIRSQMKELSPISGDIFFRVSSSTFPKNVVSNALVIVNITL